MATQTTYYEFNKPAGSDLVNPLVDNNPNWDKADAALHGLSINSIGTAVEVITLGVHALTRINQPDAKFFTFIATGDFDAGETFTLDGVAINAALPDGSSLGSDCYVTGACVLVGLNADNTLATFYLPSTGATAPDSLRLGGELPSYYATAAALANAVQSITDLDNIMGNTSISGIGDGTATGAISAINADLTELREEIPSMANPSLNYTTPLHTFNSGNLSYTATKECYLFGSVAQAINVKINNTLITSTPNVGGTVLLIPQTKLLAGDIVTLSDTAGALNVFDTI